MKFLNQKHKILQHCLYVFVSVPSIILKWLYGICWFGFRPMIVWNLWESVIGVLWFSPTSHLSINTPAELCDKQRA
jgi:hypothetical protein